ncbi:MAG: hypothetical protein U9Q82_11640 [Chloroflexota bacterium]|nr:hypothetical protein [Chloroflexota bacterium]
MISLSVVFFIFLFFFALIGSLRGWANELLVSFSVILTLFIILILENLVGGIMIPFAKLDDNYNTADVPEGVTMFVMPPEDVQPFNKLEETAQKDFRRQFWFRASILVVLVFFGYQSPALANLGGDIRREKFQDFLLGLFLGVINSYLIIGTIWCYMHLAHYPFDPYVIAPKVGDPFFETANTLINILPPAWLGTSPIIYIAICLAFLFILVVFI